MADDHRTFHRADAAAVVGVGPVIADQEVVIFIHGEVFAGKLRKHFAPVLHRIVLSVPGNNRHLRFRLSVPAAVVHFLVVDLQLLPVLVLRDDAGMLTVPLLAVQLEQQIAAAAGNRQ